MLNSANITVVFSSLSDRSFVKDTVSEMSKSAFVFPCTLWFPSSWMKLSWNVCADKIAIIKYEYSKTVNHISFLEDIINISFTVKGTASVQFKSIYNHLSSCFYKQVSFLHKRRKWHLGPMTLTNGSFPLRDQTVTETYRDSGHCMPFVLCCLLRQLFVRLLFIV